MGRNPPDSGDRVRRRFDATDAVLCVQTFVQAFVHLQDALQPQGCERARSCDERPAVTPVTSVHDRDRVAAVGDPGRSRTAAPPVADSVGLLSMASAVRLSERAQAA